jgi:hypothetical protein
MSSQVEALEPKNARFVDPPTQVAITATVANGAISFGEPVPSDAGVTSSGSTVSVKPGSYTLIFTLSGDTFSSVTSGITLAPTVASTFVTASPVEPNTSTTATVTATNNLPKGSSSATFSMTFNLADTGPIDPTLVNTADPTPSA